LTSANSVSACASSSNLESNISSKGSRSGASLFVWAGGDVYNEGSGCHVGSFDTVIVDIDVFPRRSLDPSADRSARPLAEPA
jgi:hypothetical protein